MPKPLYALTDGYYEEPLPQSLPVDIPRVVISGNVGTDNIERPKTSFLDNLGMAGVEDKSGKSENKVIKKLFGLGDEERFQLWPEKILREGITAAGKVLSGEVPQWSIDNVTGDVHTSPQMIEKAQEISALAGSGGLAGGAEGATLNATPSLRPALRYKDKLYKGKEGQQHLDVIPEQLYGDFQKKAMSGDDIAEYNFGFVNDKGQFLTREKALEYGINTGLIDPSAGKYGALTSTLMADSSKPGTAIEAMAKTAKDHFGITHNPKEAGYVLPDGSMLDLSGRHYSGGYTKAGNGTWLTKPGEKDWMHNKRDVDHRELDFMDTGGTEGMRQFMNGAGAIRNQPGIGFDITVVPTDKQLAKIISSHNSTFKGEPLKVDISNPQTGDSLASKEFPKANVEAVKKWIKEETAKYPFFKADSSKEGAAKNGYYYKNVGEDSGSISMTVPSGNHIERISPDQYILKPVDFNPFVK